MRLGLVAAAVAVALVMVAPSVEASSWVFEGSVGPVLSESTGSGISPSSVMSQGRWLEGATDALSVGVLVRYRNEPYGALWKPFAPDHGGVAAGRLDEAIGIERTHFLELGFGISAFRQGLGVTPFADLEVGGAMLWNNEDTASPFVAVRFGVARRLGEPVHVLLSAGMRTYPIADHTAAEVSLGLVLGYPATGRGAPAAN